MSGTRAPRLLGGLLWLAALILTVIGERARLDDRQDQAGAGSDVLELGQGVAPVAAEGRRVRVSGLPQVLQPPRDEAFGQAAATPVLTRRVEMFQWREVRLGGDVHYELDWADHPLDSARFAQPQGHRNPGAFPIQGQRFEAGEVRLGGLALSPALLRALPGAARLPAQTARLPENLAASFAVDGDYLSTSARAGTPQLGDLRLSWMIVPAQPVSVLARVEQGRLTPVGTTPADAVQIAARAPAAVAEPPRGLPWWRALALLLGALGALLALRGAVLARLAAGMLPIAVLAAALCVTHGPMPLLGWLALALLCLAAIGWSRRAARLRAMRRS